MVNVLDLQISSMRKNCAQKLVCPSHLVTDRQLYDTNPYNVNRVKPASKALLAALLDKKSPIETAKNRYQCVHSWT